MTDVAPQLPPSGLPPETLTYYTLQVPKGLMQANGMYDLQPVAQAQTLREIMTAIVQLGLTGKRHVVMISTVLVSNAGAN